MPQSSRSKGFTLVEVIVAFGLLVLIIGITAPLIMSAMASFTRGQRLAQAKQLGLGAYEYIESRVSPAAQVSLAGQSPGEGYSVITVEDGLLTLDGEAVYSRGLAGGIDFWLEARALEPALLEITLEARFDGDTVFTKTSAFSLVNMQKLGGQIVAPSGGESAAIYFIPTPTGD